MCACVYVCFFSVTKITYKRGNLLGPKRPSRKGGKEAGAGCREITPSTTSMVHRECERIGSG